MHVILPYEIIDYKVGSGPVDDWTPLPPDSPFRAQRAAFVEEHGLGVDPETVGVAGIWGMQHATTHGTLCSC